MPLRNQTIYLPDDVILTTAAFTIPAFEATGNINISQESPRFIVGVTVFVSDGTNDGYFKLTAVNGLQLTLENAYNQTNGSTIAAGAKISASGPPGADGATGSLEAFGDSTEPTTGNNEQAFWSDGGILKLRPENNGTSRRVALISGNPSDGEYFKWEAATGLLLPVPNIGREVLTANRTYYVRTDGSNSNTGLVDSSSGAFLTWEKAKTVISQLDCNGYEVTIKGTGSFTEAININKNFVGLTKLIIEGDTSTPANCTISPSSGDFCLRVDTLSVPVDVKGVKAGNAGANHGLQCLSGTLNLTGNCDLSGAAAALIGVSGQKSQFNIKSGFTISGDAANAAITLYDDAYLDANGAGFTVTISGSRTFGSFIVCDRGGGCLWVNASFSGGSVSAVRYTIGPISFVKAVSTTFPGSGGSVDAKGSYST